MGKSKLKQEALKHYRISRSGSWILGLTTGLLIAAIIAIDLIVPGLVIVTIPLIIVPLIFSATIQHILLHQNISLTVTNSARLFFSYFRSEFFGCFSLIMSLLKSFFVYFVVQLLTSTVASYLFELLSKDFVETIKYIYALLDSNELTLEMFENILVMNNGIMTIYLSIVVTPAFFIAILFFIYFTSRYSITIYPRSNNKAMNPRFVRLVYGLVVSKNRFKMMKDYFYLNWPLYILLIIGFAGGAILGFYWQSDLVVMLASGLVLGAVLSSFFLPFYFANQEALYDKYEIEFRKGANEYAQMLVKNLQSDIELSIEEKEKLEKAISKANSPLDDDNQEEDEGD